MNLSAYLAATPTLSGAGLNALIMVVVVFAVLCVLSLLIWLFSRMAGGQKSAASVEKRPAPVAATAPAAVAKPAAPVQTAAVSEEEDENAVAAAIAAAVAMLAPAGVTYRVKKITPAGRAQRSAWAMAAVHQNTAPF